MKCLIFLLALVAVSQADWVVVQDNIATILLGIDFWSTNEGVFAGGQDGAGTVAFVTSDGAATVTSEIVPSMGMGFAIAASNSSAVMIGLGMWFVITGAAYKQDGIWIPSEDMKAMAVAYQDMQLVPGFGYVAPGSWFNASKNGTVEHYGLAISENGGANWWFNDYDTTTFGEPRYVSFISADLGFISGGHWPTESAKDGFMFGDARGPQISRRVRLSSKVAKYTNAPIQPQWTDYRGTVTMAKAKTSSLTLVHDRNDMYFNAIRMANATHGWVVGENDVGAFILGTKDGGYNWDIQSNITMGSLMALSVGGPLEAWAGGLDLSSRPLVSLIMHTTDGGATWEHMAVPLNMNYYIMNMQCKGFDVCYAVGISMLTNLCSIIKYTP